MSTFLPPLLSRPSSGDVDLVRSTVDSPTIADPLIRLFGEPEFNEGLGVRWAHMHVAIDLRATGRRPAFALNFADWLQPTPPEGNRLYWRAAGQSRAQWQAFDQASVSGAVVTVWNDKPFSTTQIEVALTPPYTYQDILDWLTEQRGSAFVHVPPSAVAFQAANATAPDFAYYRFPLARAPSGVVIDGVHALCFRITDLTSTPLDGSPKQKLICEWSHAGAQPGLRLLFAYADWLLGTTNDAAICRRSFDHYFYLINTAGLVGGMARGTVEAHDPLLIATQTIEMR